jgi:hypothetical protein
VFPENGFIVNNLDDFVFYGKEGKYFTIILKAKKHFSVCVK